MNALAKIETDVEKFLKDTFTDAEKFATEFQKLFGKAPTALQTVDNFINEAAPYIVGAVDLVDPIAEPEVAAGLAVVETSLAAVSASAKAATSGVSLLTNLQNFAATLPTLLSGVAIKNPKLQAAIEKAVNFGLAEAKVLIPLIESWVAKIKAATPAAA